MFEDWIWRKTSTLPSTFPNNSMVLLTKDYTNPGNPEGCSQFLKEGKQFILLQSGLYKHDDQNNQLVDNVEWCELAVDSIGSEESPSQFVKAKDLEFIREMDADFDVVVFPERNPDWAK
jgi:hypothetical protein